MRSMIRTQQLAVGIREESRTWLVTGVAGFIGSHLLETLLRLDQYVIGLDDFSTSTRHNLEEVHATMPPEQWERFRFIEGDIADPATCAHACADVDYVLHEAALASVPMSIEQPARTHRINVSGHLNMITAAQRAKVRRFVYASSSAVYGSNPALPTRETQPLEPISPYGASKAINETYSQTIGRAYGIETVGLRYFNVYGPRQDPKGAYAAVICRWCLDLLSNKPATIFGDGKTTRDFCYVADIVKANLQAATVDNPTAIHQAYNIGSGRAISLLELHRMMIALHPNLPDDPAILKPIFKPTRAGDARHSLADISRAEQFLGFHPRSTLEEGLRSTLEWYNHSRFLHPVAA